MNYKLNPNVVSVLIWVIFGKKIEQIKTLKYIQIKIYFEKWNITDLKTI
jgi:hypothetical protein